MSRGTNRSVYLYTSLPHCTVLYYCFHVSEGIFQEMNTCRYKSMQIQKRKENCKHFLRLTRLLTIFIYAMYMNR